MIGMQVPSGVALLTSTELQRLQLCRRLDQLGYASVLFASSSALLAAIGKGQCFDLLLLADGDSQSWSCVSAMACVLGIPVLLLSDTLHWITRDASAQGFQAPPVFDFASLGVEDLELSIRIQTLLQRAREPRALQGERVGVGDYVFLEDARRVMRGGKEIRLQPRQFSLALELFRNLGAVVSRQSLWNLLWGKPASQDGLRALDVCVANVRKKLDLRAENGFTLRAIYRRGYQLREAEPCTVVEPGAAAVAGCRTRISPQSVRFQAQQLSTAL